MNLGENIYNLRTSRKMSQDALAEALEVSRQSVSKWENNMAVPDLDKLIKMRDLFGITLDELVAEEPPEPGEEPASEPAVETPSLFQRHKQFLIVWGLYLIGAYLLYRVFMLFSLVIPAFAISTVVTFYTVHYFRNTPFPFTRIGKSMFALCGCVAYFFGICLYSYSGWNLLDLLEAYEQYYLVIVIFHISVTVQIKALISWWKNR